MILLFAIGGLEVGGLTGLSLSNFSDRWGRGTAVGAVLDLKRPLLGFSVLSYRSPSIPFKEMDLTFSYRFGFQGGVVYSIGGHYILSDYPFSNNTLILFGGFGDYSYLSSFEAGASYSMYGGDLSYGVLQVSVSGGRLINPRGWLDVFAFLSQVSDTSTFHLSRPIFPSVGVSFKLLLGHLTPYVGVWLGEQFLTVKWYGLVAYAYPHVYRGGAFAGLTADVSGIRPGIHLTYDRMWDPVLRRSSTRFGLTFSATASPSI